MKYDSKRLRKKIEHKLRRVLEIERDIIKVLIEDNIIYGRPEWYFKRKEKYQQYKEQLYHKGLLHPDALKGGLVFKGDLLKSVRVSVPYGSPSDRPAGIYMDIAVDSEYAAEHEFGKTVELHEDPLFVKHVPRIHYLFYGNVPKRPFFYPAINQWKRKLVNRIGIHVRGSGGLLA